jgi:exosortase
VVDHGAAVPSGTTAEDRVFTARRAAVPAMSASTGPERTFRSTHPSLAMAAVHMRTFAMAIVGAAFLWAYLPELTGLWKIWQRSDEYSSGLLVPFLAAYVVWSRRSRFAECRFHPSLWGLAGLVLAQGMRHFGLFFMYSSAQRMSLVLTFASLVLFLFGWQVFKKAFTVLAFLGLMLPLPHSIHEMVTLPLQRWATSSAVFCLEMAGYAVIREGNVIHLNGTTVAIAEACNGLRMVTAFLVIIFWVALLVKRSRWEKLVLVLSSLPIAILCNTIRLTITAVTFTMLSGQNLERAFHDFGGYAMMPLALGMIVFELWFLGRLTTDRQYRQPEIVVRST